MTNTAAMIAAIAQNTAGNSQGVPAGVPSSWSWYAGYDLQTVMPPANFTACTGWGQVYPAAGAAIDTNSAASVSVEGFQTWVLTAAGAWVELQSQVGLIDGPLECVRYAADYEGNVSTALKTTVNSDGSVSMPLPGSGYVNNFWTEDRGVFSGGSVIGIFVTAAVKASDANNGLIANLGADWWLSTSAPYVASGANNPGVGSSNWIALTTAWQTLYFTSLSMAALQANPPPPLAAVNPTPVPTPVPTPAPVIETMRMQVTLTQTLNGVATTWTGSVNLTQA